MKRKKILICIISLLFLYLIFLLITKINSCSNMNNASSIQENSSSNISHEHNWEVIEEKDPTCEEAGYVIWECSICEEENRETIANTGHIEVIDQAVEPSCYKTGLTQGSHCLECGEILIKQHELPMIDHVEVIDPAIEASCEETGLTQGSHCLECGKVLIEQQIIPKHNYVDDMCEDCGSNYYTEGLEFTLLEDGNGYKVSIGSAVDEEIIIPAIYRGKPVTRIDDNAFANCLTIKSVVIPNSMLSIGFGAFEKCGFLEKITLPYVGEKDGSTINNHFGYIFGSIDAESQWMHIPSRLEEVTITNELIIDDYQFANCTAIWKINLNEGITSIGVSAFSDCYGLEIINIPKTVTSIGDSAFKSCGGLEKVELPNGLLTIGESAFYSCGALRNVVIPDSVVFIGHYSFYNCYLDSITLPFVGETLDGTKNTNFTFIFGGVSSQYMPKNLKKVTITKAKFIADEAFRGCIYIESIVLPNTIDSIGDRAFQGCTALASIVIPNSVTYIGESVFKYCENLTTITIPFIGGKIDDPENRRLGYLFGGNGISENEYFVPSTLKEVIITGSTHIVDYSFSGCSNIETIVLPDSVISIGKSAFSGCESLKYLTLGKNINIIDLDAFYNCGELSTLYYSGNIEDWINIDIVNIYSHPFGSRIYSSSLYFMDEHGEYCLVEEITIPNTVTIIQEYIFYNCARIKKVTIPDSVTSIGDYAFYDCLLLESVTIPDSVTTIGNYAFNNCCSMKNLEIGSGVTSIGDYAFYSCDDLESITIPDSVTSIGDYAFYDCYDMKNLEIGSGLNTLGNKAFNNNGKLKNIIVDDNNAYYDSRDNCNALIYTSTNTLLLGSENTILPNGIEIIDGYAFYSCNNLESITIPNSVTSIGDYAFYECDNLESIIIPDSVTSIGDYAFYDCYNMKTLVIGSGVSSIGAKAFVSNESLQYIFVDFNNNYYDSRENCNAIIEKKGNRLILGCQNTILPNNIKIIDSHAFYDCDNLKSITIPDSVTTIKSNSFAYCSGLRSVYIPNTVTDLSDYAFYDCSYKLKIYFESKLSESYTHSYINENYNVLWGIQENKIIVENQIQYLLQDNEAILMCYLGNESEVIIPSSIDYNATTYYITEISEYAFGYCEEPTTIIIGENVRKIGDSSFIGCRNLISVFIPKSVVNIGNEAFYSNSTNLIVYCETKSWLESWSNNSFEYHPTMYFLVSKNNIIELDGFHYIIKDNEAILTRYTGSETDIDICSIIKINGITYEVTSIGDYAFYNCLSLESVTIPDSVTSIGDYAFYSCNHLNSVFIPESVIFIGEFAFDCYYLSTIYCEAQFQPSTWSECWHNSYNCIVYWGVTSDNYGEMDGIKYLLKTKKK